MSAIPYDGQAETRSPQPFAELREGGLLWLINRVVFHPRGFALGLTFDDDGNCLGWDLLGDGSEPWAFAEADDDERFAAVEATFAGARARPL